MVSESKTDVESYVEKFGGGDVGDGGWWAFVLACDACVWCVVLCG